jgi:hypothetical protein
VGEESGQVKIFMDISLQSYGIQRVIDALDANLPENITRVHDAAEADLIILHVIGRNQHVTQQAKEIIKAGKKYAVIQYVLESSRNPSADDWLAIWSGAKVVWSYYDLKSKIPSPFKLVNLYHAPLASNPDVFIDLKREKKYIVCTNGTTYRNECLGEVYLSAYSVGGVVAHIGKGYANPIVTSFPVNTDETLRDIFNQCTFVSALRRKDGFEIPAVEALFCGVRPIVFDTPNYRQWFDGLADFIPEGSPKIVTESLIRLFKSPPKTVDATEARKRFNWKVITDGFWQRCMT